jgi:hypothetical protein
MQSITTEQLRGLLEASNPPCVSMFMPTHRQGRDTRQDPVQLKNLLKLAEEQLEARGMRPTEARDLLEPARLLLDENDFWQHNQEGLAIFLAPEFFRAYRVPVELAAQAHVNERFDIKPLLPLLESRTFYILAISDEHVRLMECTPRSWKRVELPEDVALTLEDAIQGEHRRETNTEHRGRHNAPQPNAGGGSFHGVGENVNNKLEEDRRFFFRQVDDGVKRTLRSNSVPIIVSGAESTAPHYIHLSELPGVMEEHIRGNPEHVSGDQLHTQGCEIMESIWHKELNDLQEQYGTALAHNLASNDVKEILPAASMGRVGILFVSTGSTHWGKITGELEIEDAEPHQPDAEDLIDRVAVETLLTNGQVVIVEPADIPGNGECAAIYRY